MPSPKPIFTWTVTNARFSVNEDVPRFRVTVKMNDVKALQVIERLMEVGELSIERKEDAKHFVISK